MFRLCKRQENPKEVKKTQEKMRMFWSVAIKLCVDIFQLILAHMPLIYHFPFQFVDISHKQLELL